MPLRRFALFLIGFTATACQILLLREFIGTFHGNELVIGIYLSVWLIATAAGSGPVARALFRRNGVAGATAGSAATAGSVAATWSVATTKTAAYTETARDTTSDAMVVPFAVVQSLSGLFFLGAIVGLLVLPSPLRPAPGEVAGLLAALASASILLFPVCLLQGLLFPLGTRLSSSGGLNRQSNQQVDQQLSRQGPADRVSRVYFIESVGAAAGGLLFGLVMIRLVSVFRNIALLSAVNLFTACFLLKQSGRRRQSQVLYLLAAAVVIVCIFDPVTHWAAERRWRGFRVVALSQSHYGNLAVVSLDSQFSTYEDGFLVFTTDDVQYAEETAHIPLLEHPAPARVLLIGGGVGGVVREMLKHKTIERIDYVELDPQLITLSRKVLPPQYVSDLEDSRVRVQYADGRRFLQKTSESYDVVVMQLPSPYTVQLNRFYTKEFFALVRSHLKPGGVFAFSAPPVAEYVGSELGAFLGSLSRTAESVFESRVIIPASRSFFVCSPGQNHYLAASPESLLSRLAARNIETLFVRDYFLTSTLSPERITYVEKRIFASERLSASRSYLVNTDLKPTSFYYDQVLWSAEYQRVMKSVLEWILRNRWTLWAFTIVVGVALPCLARRRGKGEVVLASLAISGFAAMVLELEILLCFQVLYGGLYDRIGVLLTSYMMGLAIGVVLERRGMGLGPESAGLGPDSAVSGPDSVGLRSRSAGPAILRRPAVIQIATAALALCFLGLVCLVTIAATRGLVAGPGSHNPMSERVARSLVSGFEWLFPGLALVAGGLGGAMFSSASRAFFAFAPSGSAGVTYAWDLVGSWLGAVLCSVVFFPVAGVAATIAVVAVLLVASGLSLAYASR